MNDLITTDTAVAPTQLSEVLDPAIAEQVIANGVNVAKQATDVIEKLKLYARIRGKKFITVEGYAVLAAMWQLGNREVAVEEDADGNVIATVELIRLADGAVIGRASAMVGVDEKDWSRRPKFQRRSMAVTRALGKAYRMTLSWIVRLAGYQEVTPAEEIKGTVSQTPTPPREVRLVEPEKSNTRDGNTVDADAANTITIDARHESGDSDPASASQLEKIRTMAKRAGIDTQEAQRDLLEQFNIKKLSGATVATAEKIISHIEWLETQVQAPF